MARLWRIEVLGAAIWGGCVRNTVNSSVQPSQGQRAIRPVGVCSALLSRSVQQ